MFHISDISGDQILYNDVTFRAQRDIERLHEEIVQEQFSLDLAQRALGATTALNTPNQDAVIVDIQLAAGEASASPLAGVNTQAMGLAGASMLYQTEGAAEATAGANKAPAEPVITRELEPVIAAHGPSKTSVEDYIRTTDTKHVGAQNDPELGATDTPSGVLARDIMSSPVVSLQTTDNLDTVAELFDKHRFRHLPVVSKDNKLVGIFSDRDLLRALTEDKDGKVEDLMIRNILSTRPDTDIRSIAQVLFQERIGAMPIVGEDGQLAGMLTRSDILRTVVNQGSLELWTG